MDKAKAISDDLMQWYHENKRDLPFRGIDHPYFTWVSEIMLQQTQVDTMIPYFNRFIKRFKTPCELAEASFDEVLKYWEGLGYYRRARHLHASAQVICEKYNGIFPDDLAAIESLKGVGRYIARAIHSIAFNQPSPAVDGNVMRVISRLLADGNDLTKVKHQRIIEKNVEAMIQHQTPRDFTQALMELGAMVCQKKPQCAVCPLQKHCLAYQTNSQSLYPNIPQKTKVSAHQYHVFVVLDRDRSLLIKRPDEGLLANLYTFPQYELSLASALAQFSKDFNVEILRHRFRFQISHLFSHQKWDLQVYQLEIQPDATLPWVKLSDFPYAIAKAHLKIIDRL